MVGFGVKVLVIYIIFLFNGSFRSQSRGRLKPIVENAHMLGICYAQKVITRKKCNSNAKCNELLTQCNILVNVKCSNF